MVWIWTRAYNQNKKYRVISTISQAAELVTVIFMQQFLHFRFLLLAHILIFLNLKNAVAWNMLLNDFS